MPPNPKAMAAALRRFKDLVAREAPEQLDPIIEAMRQTAQSGREHSVIGNTMEGGASTVSRGTPDQVIPNAFDLRQAVKAPGSPDIIDFHTHPPRYEMFEVAPSPDDMAFYTNEYKKNMGDRELKTLIGTPLNRTPYDPDFPQDPRPRTAYNFFATQHPSLLSPDTAAKMRGELQLAGSRGAFDDVRRDPRFEDYFTNVGDIGDVLGDAAPLLMQRYRAMTGMGRHELQLSGEAISPEQGATNTALFDALVNPAMGVIKARKFAEGGSANVPNPSPEADALAQRTQDPQAAKMLNLDLMTLHMAGGGLATKLAKALSDLPKIGDIGSKTLSEARDALAVAPAPTHPARLQQLLDKVRHIDELGAGTNLPERVDAPRSAVTTGWHVAQDLEAPLLEGLLTNRNVGEGNSQGWVPRHVGGAYFYSDPELARFNRERLFEDFPPDEISDHDYPVFEFTLNHNKHNFVPDEDNGSVDWLASHAKGSFATKNPVNFSDLQAIYSGDPLTTQGMITDLFTKNRMRFAEGGRVQHFGLGGYAKRAAQVLMPVLESAETAGKGRRKLMGLTGEVKTEANALVPATPTDNPSAIENAISAIVNRPIDRRDFMQQAAAQLATRAMPNVLGKMAFDATTPVEQIAKQVAHVPTVEELLPGYVAKHVTQGTPFDEALKQMATEIPGFTDAHAKIARPMFYSMNTARSMSELEGYPTARRGARGALDNLFETEIENAGYPVYYGGSGYLTPAEELQSMLGGQYVGQSPFAMRKALRQIEQVDPLLSRDYAATARATHNEGIKHIDARMEHTDEPMHIDDLNEERAMQGYGPVQELPQRYRDAIRDSLEGADEVEGFAGGGQVTQDEGGGLSVSQMAAALKDMAVAQGKEEWESLDKPRATTDLINRGFIANLAGAPVDILNMGLQGISSAGQLMGLGGFPVSEKPVGGSDWLRDKMVDLGVASDAERPLMESAMGLISPNVPVKAGTLAAKGAKAVTPFAKDAAGMAAELYAQGRMPGMIDPAFNVIKPKGGQWVPGGVERNIDVLRPWEPEQLRPELAAELGLPPPADTSANDAINSWIDRRLIPYVKNDMGTPGDPVRALAEKGTLHFEPNTPETGSLSTDWVKGSRAGEGFPPEGLGQSQLAKDWEYYTDSSIVPYPASVMQERAQLVARHPWIAKLDPESRINQPLSYWDNSNFGFNHITDELQNALNPTSGLPQNLLIEPEKLGKMTMPDVVQHVAKINEWRTQNASKAALQVTEGMPVHKEYPEQGFKWLELTSPEKLTESQLAKYSADPRTKLSLGDVPAERGRRLALDDALKYEGDTMGHCVGRYAEDVASGKSQIFSLRDKKNEPHVTIETAPGEKIRTWDQLASAVDAPTLKRLQSEFDQHNAFELPDADFKDVLAEVVAREGIQLPQKISQIKGKGNAAPKAQYLPFVQDFVKSGNWGEVGDFHNTGLIDTQVQYPPETLAKIKAAGITPARYITDAEHADIKSKVWPPGMKKGGRVKFANNTNDMRLELALGR